MSWTIKKAILVPYDFSEHSHAAIEKALELTDDKTLVHVIHVLPYPLVHASFPVEEIDDQVRIEYAEKLMAGEFQEGVTGLSLQI